MSDRLLKESDVLKIAFQLPYVVNSVFFDAVKALPSAERRGEWIDLQTFDEWYGHAYQCSVCGRDGLNWDFCPNCGARMKGAEDE